MSIAVLSLIGNWNNFNAVIVDNNHFDAYNGAKSINEKQL